ncbi:MAG TPA: ribosome-associated translation inhibitor RaiA [Steroidobacteraceae bacterium]|nr:ribosome-associated translation inhibitor RaiA [Steroidobacteraceae bacterium]
MRLTVKGHHLEITASMRGYVEKKMARIVRHFDQVIDVHCVLTVEKLHHKAEATLHVSGSDIHADAAEPSMYAAIDVLSDKLERCVRKHKEKLTDHRTAGAPRTVRPQPPA